MKNTLLRLRFLLTIGVRTCYKWTVFIFCFTLLWHEFVYMPDREVNLLSERYAHLFRNGCNQVNRIPREFALAGNEAIIRREGNRLNIEALHRTSLLAFLAVCKPSAVDFPDIDTLPPLDDALF